MPPNVMLNLVQHLTASLFLVLLRGQILKQVQDDHLLWAIVICYIEVMYYPRKRLYCADKASALSAAREEA